MSEVQPQPGDKVRVSYEGVVEKVGVETIQLDVGSVHAKHGSGVIEILKRADDPSSDEIGTIRGSHGGASYIRLTQEGDKDWWSLHEFRWVHSVTAGAEPVTGAVPGTPAAQAQRQRDDADREREFKALAKAEQSQACGDYSPKGELGGIYYTVCLNCGFGGTAHGKREPLVVQYGGPEPDTRRTYRSSNGITVEMGTFGWRVIQANGDATINVPWSGIPERHFPMTEVVVGP